MTSSERASSRARRLGNLGLAVFMAVLCMRELVDHPAHVLELASNAAALCISAFLIVSILGREPAETTDVRWWVCLVCTASLCSFLIFEPPGKDSGFLAQVAYGVLLALYLLGGSALAYLARSFAILPSRRVVRTGWMYRIVRHPAYALYMVGDVVYVATTPTGRNLFALTLSVALLVARASLEERVLNEDVAYRVYAARTRYRFFPRIY